MADITKQKNIGDYGTTSVTDTMQVLSYEPGEAEGNRTKRLPFSAAVNAVIDQSVKNMPQVFSVAEAKALTGLVAGQAIYLSDGGRSGEFIATLTDISTQVAADPLQGVYVAFASDPTGASGGLVRVINDVVLPEWWGVDDSGSTDGTSELYAAQLAAISVGGYVFCRGVYSVNSMQIHRYADIRTAKGAYLKPNTASVSMLYTADDVADAQDVSLMVNIQNPDNTPSVTLVDLPQMRHAAGLKPMRIKGGGKSNNCVGVNLPKLNWNTRIYGVEVDDCGTAWRLRNAAAVLKLQECSARNNGTAFDLLETGGDLDRMTMVHISGGVCQENDVGVKAVDCTALIIEAVHFENNTIDIDADGTDNLTLLYPEFRGDNVGLASTGVRLRNTTETTIFRPVFAGTRQNGFLDIDTSNSRCELDVLVSADAPTRNVFWNGGDLSGCKIVPNRGYVRPAGGTSIVAKIPVELVTKTVPDGGVAMTTTTSDEGDLVKILFRTSSGYTTGAITFNGVAVDLTGVAPNKNKTMTFEYIAASGGWVVVGETGWY